MRHDPLASAFEPSSSLQAPSPPTGSDAYGHVPGGARPQPRGVTAARGRILEKEPILRRLYRLGTVCAMLTVLCYCAPKEHAFALEELPDYPFDTVTGHSQYLRGHLYINCLLNDTLPICCLFDTGAPGLMLDRTFCEHNGIPLDGGKRMRVGGVGTAYEEILWLEDSMRLAFQGARAGFDRVIVYDLKGLIGRRIDALVGADLFAGDPEQGGGCIVSLDFTRGGRVEVLDSLPAHEAWRAVPLLCNRFLQLYCPVSLLFPNKRIEGWAQIDTGNGGSLHLTTYTAESNGLTALPCDTSYTLGIGGRSPVYTVRCDSITLASYRLGGQKVSYSRNRSGGMHGATVIDGQMVLGLLGTEELSRFHVVMDLDHDSLYLRPNRRFDARPLRLLPGFSILDRTDTGAGWIVRFITPRSAAERAGLAEGDTIVRIGSHSVAAFASEDDPLLRPIFCDLTRSFTLTVSREGRHERIHINNWETEIEE